MKALPRRKLLAGLGGGIATGMVAPYLAWAQNVQCNGSFAAPVKPLSSPRKLTIAWNETAICVAAVPVAREKGFFARHNLDVDYVNFGGATDQLLEAISTGKADAAPGMVLRWLKPLQQGFDVKLVAGLHAGCMYLMVPQKSSIRTLADLKGKTVGVTDMGGPDRNFFSIRVKEAGLDPESDVSWRAFPPDLLPLALQRGDVQAISDSDPLSLGQRKQFGLRDIDSNMTGDWARTAARIFQPYAPRVSVDALADMIRMEGHHHQTLADPLRTEITRYAEALKTVGVFRPSFDTERYAARVTQDLFS
jgi:NitT/TauT family transport system substrate-binding protein